jgi:hypothetical protein
VTTLIRKIENLAGEIRSISSILQTHEKLLENSNSNSLSSDSPRNYSELACYFAGLVGQYEIGLRTLKQLNHDVDTDSKLSLLRLNFGGSQLKVRRKSLAIEFAKYEFSKLNELRMDNSEDAFSFACELRHLIAVTRALSSEELMSELNEICSKFLSQFGNLDQISRNRASRSIANLLSDYKIYPSVKLGVNTSLADTHWVLFEAANLNGSENMRINGLTEALEKSGVNSEIKKTIQIVLSSIQEIASESGRGALSIVGDERGMPWPREIGDLSIIPGDGASNCSSVILAISDSSKRSGRYSPKSVMTKVQQSIIRCRGTLKAVIFLTDPAAIGGEVEEHLPIIEDNIQAGDIEVFLPVTIVGRRLNVLDWK